MIGYMLGGLALLVVVGLVWGVLHLRHSQRVAHAAIAGVRVDQVPALREECERVFADVFGETLSLDALEASARILSARLDAAESLKGAFARPEFYWYFVLPVGAYLGELLRVHAGGHWEAGDGAGPSMQVPVSGGFATTHPFDKVIKQVMLGDKGDIYAYLMTAVRLDEVLGDAQGEPC